MANKPNPGQTNTVSTIIVPVKNPTKIRAAKVKGGIRAFYKACFHITIRSGTPFARANLIYSESKISNIEDLVNLK